MEKIKLRQRRIFSEDLRKQIVEEYESGRFTVNELAKLHATYRRTVYRWIYRYSICNQKNIKVVESNQSSDKKLKELYARIKELEAALGRSKLENEFNAKMIELAKEELGIDLKKNFGTTSSNPSKTEREKSKTWSMKQVYEVAGITRQAHSKQGIKNQRRKEQLEEVIINADALRKQHPGCGVEKMYQTLKPDFVGRDRFIAIMMESGYRLKKVRNYRHTTYAGAIHYPNLIQGMMLQDKNQLWQSDITYIDVNGKFYYLVMIIDVYTREIIGYALSNHLRADANVGALQMAIQSNSGSLKGLIHHSDRGSQYSSKEYLKLLHQHGILPSMGLKGQENAYAEKLNDTIKNEYIAYRKITNESALTKIVRQTIHHYNQVRIHNELPNRISPKRFADELLSLTYPQRPKVIVYTEGKQRVRDVSNIPDSLPHKDLRAPVCPIIYN